MQYSFKSDYRLIERQLVGTNILDLSVSSERVKVSYHRALIEQGKPSDNIGKLIYQVHFDSWRDAVQCFNAAVNAHANKASPKRVLRYYVETHVSRGSL